MYNQISKSLKHIASNGTVLPRVVCSPSMYEAKEKKIQNEDKKRKFQEDMHIITKLLTHISEYTKGAKGFSQTKPKLMISISLTMLT